MCSALPHTLTCLKWTRLKRCLVSVPRYSNVKNGSHTELCKLCTRTWVAKKSAADCNRAPGLLATLLVDDSQGARFHAVDAPRGVALLVADRDGESAVVGPDQVDLLALLALDFKAGTLAPVLRPPLGTVSLGK